MAEIIQVRKKAQLTLPLSVRQELGVEEGDYMEVQVRNGEIVLKLKRLIDKDQAWFWTERWQEGEKAAEEDIRYGRIHDFPDAASAVGHLHTQEGQGPSAIDKKGK